MGVRGPYAKGVARRTEILDAALTVIARDGYSAASVKQIADEVGLSQNGLLHYVGSKETLFTDVLERRDELARATATSGEVGDFAEALAAIVRRNAGEPGVIDLFVRVVAEASEPAHPGHARIRERYAALRAEASEIIARRQREGEIRRDLDPHHAAALIYAVIDGLQNQFLYDRELDMAAHVDTLAQLLRPQPSPEEAP